MNPFLKGLSDDVDALEEEFRNLIDDLAEEEWVQQPAPKSWSILSCVRHLNRTGEEYIPRIRACISSAHETHTSASEPYRPTRMGRLFVSSLAPDAKRRLKAPRLFRPESPDSSAQERATFLSQLEDLRHLINAASKIDFNSPRFSSPVTRFVRFSIADGLLVVVTHARRHVKQIARAKEKIRPTV